MTATPMMGRIELPAAGTWSIDPGNAEVAFVTRQFRLRQVRGRFTRIDGTVRGGVDTPEPTVDVTIDMASVATGSARRDKHRRDDRGGRMTDLQAIADRWRGP